MSSTNRTICALAGAAGGLALLGMPRNTHAQTATFQPLGLYTGGVVSQANSHATAISADGSIVAGYATGVDPMTGLAVTVAAYRPASGGAWQAIPQVGYSSADAVSADGSVIVGTGPLQIVTGAFTPFVFRSAPPPGGTTLLPMPSTRFSGVSADGQTAAGRSYGSAIVWSQSSGMHDLGHIAGFGGTTASASAISADGLTVAGSDTGPATQAFLWTQSGGMRGLGFLNNASRFSEARAVSGSGSVIVGHSTNGSGLGQAFVWRASSPSAMVALPMVPGSTGSDAYAISTNGAVIVGQSQNGTADSAFFWDQARGPRNLQDLLTSLGATGLTGWTLTRATAVSSDGTVIVGNGTDPQGRLQAWLARVPASSTTCYANCDASTTAPVLNVNDFLCFQTRFAAGDSYANCDGSTTAPTLNVNDFLCFQQHFAAGCP